MQWPKSRACRAAGEEGLNEARCDGGGLLNVDFERFLSAYRDGRVDTSNK